MSRLARRVALTAALAAGLLGGAPLRAATGSAPAADAKPSPETKPAATPQPGAAPAPAAAATPQDDRPLDERTYFKGLEAIRQGRREEGSKALRTVFQEFPDSPFAAPAAMRVAEMIYPVTTWDQVGSAAPEAIKQAGDLFLAVTQKYRSSREASRALVRLGYLAIEPANPKADLDEACTRFATAAQVYPDSDAADDAYFGSGMCESLRARPARAADFFARLLDENPGSPLATESLYRFGVALSRLDDPAEAMLALQQLRVRYPESRFASRALDRITLVHRLRLAPPLAPRAGPAGTEVAGLYAFDETYGPQTAPKGDENQTIRGAGDLAIDAQGLAVVASPKSPGVFRLDARGKVQEKIANPNPDYVAVGEGLAVYISGRGQIALNARNWSGAALPGLEGRPVRDFGPIAIDPSGRVYLLDTSDDLLLIFDRGRRLVGNVRPAAPNNAGRFVDVAMNEDGGVYVLDGRGKMVLELHQARQTRRIDLAPLGLQEAIALAVDALGDLYLLDGRTGWVTITDPAGKRITILRPDRQVQARLGEPSSVAVDAVGRVYLSGRKTGQVVRYR
ncbi:MAG TPA: tetratricopeptide repeat protein [Candidatus Polarisedimenticolia bacterium]|nr:tetratricopeptide repeat protein [Candidatus Polarisedimenticolia bacterium]